MKLLLQRLVDSPLGVLHLAADIERRVVALDFSLPRMTRGLRERFGDHGFIEPHDPFPDIAKRIEAYFTGDLDALADLAVDASGTSFQREVWNLLRTVPAGRTITYGELAQRLGQTDPRDAIDVGAAVGANPIALIIPCHRVIGSGGELKRFAWGLDRKRWLLTHERADLGAGTSGFLPGFGP